MPLVGSKNSVICAGVSGPAQTCLRRRLPCSSTQVASAFRSSALRRRQRDPLGSGPYPARCIMDRRQGLGCRGSSLTSIPMRRSERPMPFVGSKNGVICAAVSGPWMSAAPKPSMELLHRADVHRQGIRAGGAPRSARTQATAAGGARGAATGSARRELLLEALEELLLEALEGAAAGSASRRTAAGSARGAAAGRARGATAFDAARPLLGYRNQLRIVARTAGGCVEAGKSPTGCGAIPLHCTRAA